MTHTTNPDVTDEDIAHMVMLAGMNYKGSEIAEITGFSDDTVYKHLNRIEDLAKEGDWRKVYWRHVLPAVIGADFMSFMADALSNQ